MNINLNTEL